MTPEERIAQLERENAALQAEKAALQAELKEVRRQMQQMLARLAELEGRVAKDSHNSSKPPSSDGPARRRQSLRQPSNRKPGGQVGHPGASLQMVEPPDEILTYRPQQCAACQQPLEVQEGMVVERRQVHDLPAVRLVVREHQIEQVQCPHCQQVSRGSFLAAVSAPVQYGPRLRSLEGYLQQYQLLPLERTCEALADLRGCSVSAGTLVQWVQEAAERIAPSVTQIAERIIASRLQHADETGVWVRGHLYWLHVNSTRLLTHLAWHPKRGRAALEAIGIWPRFRGGALRDRWASYDQYACAQSLCGAHLVRELTFLHEQDQQAWAGELKAVLLGMQAAAEEWRSRGARQMPAVERDDWVAQYFAVLAQGFAAQAPPAAAEPTKRRGRQKQSAAKNLLDDLLRRAEQVLAFVDDLTIPFTNNQAERDLRMVKVQQKIAGTFRSEAGVTAFCRLRSYLSTMRKQGQGMFGALAAVFDGYPLPVAWAPE